MRSAVRLALVALAAAALGCGSNTANPPGLLLAEPSAVAVFRGFTTKTAELHPYLAIANAGSNDLTVLDAVDDAVVPAPVPLRALVIPVANRPALLASAELGDGGPDLLVAVSAGGASLQVIRTWAVDLAIAGEVPLGGDVRALAAVPTPAAGQARIAAALSGGRFAVVSFARAGVDGAIAPTGTLELAVGFQPVSLAVTPGRSTIVWAATHDPLPAGGAFGVAGIDPVSGAVTEELAAGAPTRLVAAARLAERGQGEAGLDPLGWATTAPVERVYAVLDESGCGLDQAIACGLVALDPAGGGIAPDLANPLLPRPPLAIPGRALALAASGPAAEPPSPDPADRLYADPYLRIALSQGPRATTGAAAVASSDGTLYHVDLGRFEIPSDQPVAPRVSASATAARAATVPPVDQWLVLDPDGTGSASPRSHLDPVGLSTAVEVTPGFTPSARWTVVHEGVLPGLSSRHAQAGNDGTPWLALQTGSAGAFGEVIRIYDPTLGVRAGDTVVIEPAGLATCTAAFEATVADLVQPDAARFPGGAVHLAEKDAGNLAWHACFLSLGGLGSTVVPGQRATFRAGGLEPYVLVRGTGTAAVHVGRPALGVRFAVEAADESLFSACLLPPRVPWPASPGAVPSCDDACRVACQDLLRARLARRISYVPETCGENASCLARWPLVTDVAGPALAIALALETAAAPPRDLTLQIDTSEGRTHWRAVDPLGGAGVDPRSVVAFDRSPYVASEGIRFLVPFASGVVLDASPSHRGVAALR